jgi:DNA-binding MarR family transcriptional regulator
MIGIVNTLDSMARPHSLEKLIWEVRRTFRDLRAAADRELEHLGIQSAGRALLEFLTSETEPVSLSDLARKYAVSRQHIHQVLRSLPDPEWVEELRDAGDRRAVRLQLSRKGRAFWTKVRAADQRLLKRLAKELSEDQVTASTDVLRKLRCGLPPRKGSR